MRFLRLPSSPSIPGTSSGDPLVRLEHLRVGTWSLSNGRMPRGRAPDGGVRARSLGLSRWMVLATGWPRACELRGTKSTHRRLRG